MHNLAAKRTAKLREQMAKHGIDLYVVPTADYHGSEYVGEHFKASPVLQAPPGQR